MCLVPGGHRKVLEAMMHLQKHAAERTRFQLLMCELDRSTGKYREEVSLKTAIMSFINAALRYGPGQDHLEFRLHLRHLDFFEMVRSVDEKELSKRFEGTHVDSKSASAMFEVLRKKLSLTAAYPHLLSIMYHLLLLPYGKSDVYGVWALVDKILQQVILQQKNGQDPDGAPLENINLKSIVMQLQSETDIKVYQQKLREAEKASDELNAKLAKKERECEVRLEEKEEITNTMNMMKARLEKETASHAETRRQLEDLLARVEDIRSQMYQSLDLEEFERTFSAYQKPTEDGDEDQKSQSSFTKPKATVLTVIDGRRAQNCTILLSKLKLTNAELAKAIMNVDEGEDLPKDMVEQLLKFVPTAEETQLLSEYSSEIDNMARADRFLYEMSNFKDLDQEINSLRKGLQDIEKEVEYFKNKFASTPGDRFVTVMQDFCTVVSYSFTEVEEAYTEMKQKYDSVLKAFCEDSKQVQPDVFFGIFDTFLTSFGDAKCENDKMKKQKEEEEKRKKIEEQMKKEREKRLLLRRGSSTADKDHKVTVADNPEKGEFDDLISALRTGDVFGEDLAKLKRRGRRVGAQADFSRERNGERESWHCP
nr:hypothetical protein BaRGS_035168 [Batillaria attramentaria]